MAAADVRAACFRRCCCAAVLLRRCAAVGRDQVSLRLCISQLALAIGLAIVAVLRLAVAGCVLWLRAVTVGICVWRRNVSL